MSFDIVNAEWIAHRHVEQADAIRFIPVPRAAHETIPFLTDDCLGPRGPAVDVAVTTCLAAAEKRPLNIVFHSAFCASTLLTRALSRPGTAMGLSEPVLLNDVVGLRQRGARGAEVARIADTALRLLARPFGPGEAVVVKPSNLINPLAELFMALQPQARAVFLYAPLETFLISVARKGLPCRLWVRELMAKFLPEGLLAPLGIEPEDVFRQTDLQVAAAGWLAQHRLFLGLAQKLGPDRLILLDADALTGSPAPTLARVARHFRLDFPAGAIEEIAGGPAFTRHSKSGSAFTPEDRRIAYAAARGAHGEEIDMVMDWAGKVAAGAGIALDPAPAQTYA
ncbi:hypothetical protein [Novosphingobium sp. KCTC 2891]|uniref:hypothetical protein n=1 Tax=Novosphingobium sp. KCTC 2891 TaxID=2989730 RepID=UPI00222312EB|nr:hypothetical protein [Novosphingobium sp. KCTC 2891]